MMLIQHRLKADQSAYQVKAAIENATSVVWTERWQDYGEAEITVPLGRDVKVGDLFTIPGRGMAAEVIGRTETQRDITLRCRDALSVLDRRIVYPTVSNNGLVRTFVEKMLRNDDTVLDDPPAAAYAEYRTLIPVRVGDLTAIQGSASLQRSYKHLGQAIVELSKGYGFDATATLDGNGHLVIGARTGSATRTWGYGRNLAGYTMDQDTDGYYNAVYVGGQIKDNGERAVEGPIDDPYLNPSNMDAWEEFIDRRDLSMSGLSLDAVVGRYGDLTVDPNGDYDDAKLATVTEGESSPYTVVDLSMEVELRFGDEDDYVVMVATIPRMRDALGNVPGVEGLISAADTSVASKQYSGRAVTNADDELIGWRVNNAYTIPLSVLDRATFDVTPIDVTLTLDEIGEAALKESQPETLFEATVEGLTPYRDYALGDTVTVYLRTGAKRTGIVREIIESWDSSGYRANPTLDFGPS